MRSGFREEDFAHLHPGGKLGKRLMRVEQIMQRTAIACRSSAPRPPWRDVIHEMSSKRLGMACVVGADGRLTGIVTDGDLRRHMSPSVNLLALTAADVMTPQPVTIGRGELAVAALKIMEDRKITSLVVVDERGAAQGVLHLHDLWHTQMF